MHKIYSFNFKLYSRTIQRFAVFFMFVFSTSAYAQTLFIDSSVAVSGNGSSWATAYKEFRDAIPVIQANPSILIVNIAKGTYKPTSDSNRDSSFTIFRGGIKIFGGYPGGGGTRDFGANPVKLDGLIQPATNSYHVMVITGLSANADSVVLDGLTFINGAALINATRVMNGQSVSRRFGGGLYCQSNLNGNKIAVRNCVFSNNNANIGSGVYNNLSGAPVYSNCSFVSNIGTGNLSIGVNSYGTGMYNHQTSPILTDCIFENNTMNRSGYGRGMYNEFSSPVITNCRFSSNLGGSVGIAYGGAICNISCSIIVSHSTFNNNSVGGSSGPRGGGIYNETTASLIENCIFSGNNGGTGGAVNNTNSSPVTITNCTFISNNGGNIGGDGGGGIYNNASSPSITNCTFIKNTGTDGVGIHNMAGSAPLVGNCTFYGNMGMFNSSKGPGVFCADSSGGRYRNCIFSKDTVPFSNTPISIGRFHIYSQNDGSRPSKPRPSVSYSILRDTLPIINVIDSGGNQRVNPFFVDTVNIIGPDNVHATADDGLRLQLCSAGIDAGHNSAIPAGITTDVKGDARINNNTVDLGAYENPSPNYTTIALNGDSVIRSVNAALEVGSSCRLAAMIAPSGANPVANGIKMKVTIDNTVQSFNGYPYVQRHYDLAPVSNAPSATATITLYYTQAEFTAYNAARGIYPPMPVDAADAANNKANILVHQFHGTAAGGSSPANYAGTDETIVPTSVVWNATNNWWTVTFNVTGFSGFFLNTIAAPIPVVLEYFNGRKQKNDILFSWKANCSNSPFSTFTLERSNTGSLFAAIYQTQVSEQRCLLPFDFTDTRVPNGKSFYRLSMLDANGKLTFSNTLFFNNLRPDEIFVGPTILREGQVVNIGVQQKGFVLSLYNSNGGLLEKWGLEMGLNNINLKTSVAGLYFYRVLSHDGQMIKSGKILLK